ncbi:hypothetical protein L211DRAFT_884895 [Terfezia boudieri ATCC MYA-4762]|uniref:Uncharacterized protein n=1 Tax=Terfezia boudieri ATCC MYA-4762 TaxID=1051890 RepID=A0A3N4LI02_9PEZI|nr:hypothetical protein L211DRAFT_884895 [Terfezia boudieri ATCC MYA-4762]
MSSSYFLPPKTPHLLKLDPLQEPPQAQTMSSDNKDAKPSAKKRLTDAKEASATILEELKKKRRKYTEVKFLIGSLTGIQQRGEQELEVLKDSSKQDGGGSADMVKDLESILKALGKNMKAIEKFRTE